jgi:glycosyltransferase involved in cell wall biosynthesis
MTSHVETNLLPQVARLSLLSAMEKSIVLQCCLSGAWGGQEMVAFETAMRLREQGVSVTTACAPSSTLLELLQKNKLPAIAVERNSRYFSFSAIKALRQAVKQTECRTVLTHQMNDLWQLVPALWGRPQVRLVGISHSLVGVNKKDRLHRWLYSRLNTLIALTNTHKTNLIERLPLPEQTVAVIPNSVDMTLFHPSRRNASLRAKVLQSSDQTLIGVVSRLDPQKGLFECLDAAKLLLDSRVNFQMHIVGKDTEGQPGTQKRLAARIEELGLAGSVKLLGHRTDIPELVASFDVLLMPSPAETFGRVLIEAMASRVAVVACRGGGVPDIVEHNVNGLLIPPSDPAHMAIALKTLCADASLREKLAAGGLKVASERFEAKLVQQHLLELLVQR